MWQNSLILTWQSLYSHTAYLLIDKVCFCFSLCCCCCCYCVCFLMFKWEDWQFWLKNKLWVIPAKKFLTFLPQFSSHPCDLCFLAIDQEIKEKKSLILNWDLLHTAGLNIITLRGLHVHVCLPVNTQENNLTVHAVSYIYWLFLVTQFWFQVWDSKKDCYMYHYPYYQTG